MGIEHGCDRLKGRKKEVWGDGEQVRWVGVEGNCAVTGDEGYWSFPDSSCIDCNSSRGT